MIVMFWVALGIVLLAVELHHLALYVLFGSLGAFAAAAVAGVAPSAIPLQVAVAVAVALLGILLVRPYVSRSLHTHLESRPGRGVHGTLVGEEVITLDLVGDETRPGHVRLAGERWLAVSGSSLPVPPGTRVLVTAVRGTTLTVWPTDGSVGYVDPQELQPPPDPGGEGGSP
ncbi:MAG: NfeD family protein [Acidimicrobiales bacterium]|nr:NfeD family protein [Acidimicrobiales bacterium]